MMVSNRAQLSVFPRALRQRALLLGEEDLAMDASLRMASRPQARLDRPKPVHFGADGEKTHFGADGENDRVSISRTTGLAWPSVEYS